LIQLRDPLDEPEYYCVDVPGFGASLNLEGALTAHTCKPNGEDELFLINHPATGQLYMPAYERCVEAATGEAGADLYLKDCNDSALQKFSYEDETTLQLDTDAEALCLSVADEAGEPTGGPSHLRLDLLLASCTSVEPVLSEWALPGPEIP
ncbi:MAG: RICIN domain-containing protein, partial [Chloroflexota bacterium]